MSHDYHPPTASHAGAPGDDPQRTATGAFEAPGLEANCDPGMTTPAQSPRLAGSSRPFATEPPAPPGYEIRERIGSGGMGDVYRAREIAFDRDVAVKFLQDRYPADSAAARRFLDEARITAQLQHPAIPPVHHIGTLADGRPFLAMKLIKGETLADKLASNPGSPEFIQVFLQICQAVGYAHARKVIHRDLKPANIMVGAFGEVQVMDWGLAKVLMNKEGSDTSEVEAAATEIRSLRDSDSATQSGSILGTPAYMAPEQAWGQMERIDERTDVFGLGAVLCTILTGQPPYWGGDTNSIRLKAVRGDTGEAFARLDASGADPELIALCKRCLDAEQASRPRDAGEVARAVAEHLAAAEERARQAELDRVRSEGERANAEIEARERRKRQRVQFALAGSVLLVVALTGFGAGLASLWQDAARAHGEAETARDQIAGEKRLTEAARDDLARERERLVRVEYARTVDLAHREWKANNLDRARQLLDSCRTEQRGWEWHYVYRLSHPVQYSLDVEVQSTASFSPDGRRIVTDGSENTAKVWDAATGKELLTLSGHTATLRTTGFNADSSRIVTGSDDGTARVWDARTGKAIHTLEGQRSEAIAAASFSPDGTRIVAVASGMESGRVWLWDAVTGKTIQTLPRHVAAFPPLFSPDSRHVLTCEQERTLQIWEVQTGQPVAAWKAHTSPIKAVSYSPDGTQLVTGSYAEAIVWDLKENKPLVVFDEHRGYVNAATFSSNGQVVLTCSDDQTAKLWYPYPIKNSQCIATLVSRSEDFTGQLIHAAFAPGDTRVLTLDLGNHLRYWDRDPRSQATWKATHLIDDNVTGITHFILSPDGQQLLTRGGDSRVRVRDAWAGEGLLRLPHDTAVSGSAVSPDGTWLLHNPSENRTEVRDISTGQLRFAIENPGISLISPDGSRIFTTGNNDEPQAWDVSSRKVVLTFKDDGKGIAAAFSPDGTQIATCHEDKTVKIWNAKTGDRIRTLEAGQSPVDFIAFCTGGSYFVGVSEDGTAKVWDAKTGQIRRSISDGTTPIRMAYLNRDGDRILTRSTNDRDGPVRGSIKLWDATTGSLVVDTGVVDTGRSDCIMSGTFSADGTRFVIGSNDLTATVRDAKSGTKILTLTGHTDSIQTAAFSPDGTRIVTAGAEGAVKLWDAVTGTELITLPSHTQNVFSASFSPDGTRIVSTHDDDTVRVWDARPLNPELLTKEPAPPP